MQGAATSGFVLFESNKKGYYRIVRNSIVVYNALYLRFL